MSSPAVIQASIPEQGRLLTFSHAVAVDNFADLQIGIKAKAVTSASWFLRLAILASAALAFSFAARFAKDFNKLRASRGAK